MGESSSPHRKPPVLFRKRSSALGQVTKSVGETSPDLLLSVPALPYTQCHMRPARRLSPDKERRPIYENGPRGKPQPGSGRLQPTLSSCNPKRSLAALHRLQLRPRRDLSKLEITPQRNQQPPRKRHHPNAPGTLPTTETLHEPPTERRIRLVTQPQPAQLNHQGAHPPVPRFDSPPAHADSPHCHRGSPPVPPPLPPPGDCETLASQKTPLPAPRHSPAPAPATAAQGQHLLQLWPLRSLKSLQPLRLQPPELLLDQSQPRIFPL